jgi:hypothetical protein
MAGRYEADGLHADCSIQQHCQLIYRMPQYSRLLAVFYIGPPVS